MNPKKENLIKFLSYLKIICPNPKCSLSFSKDYEFLIKVMLSAQCKDSEVNKYADKLFKKFNSLEKLSKAKIDDIKEIIKPLGFSENKSKNIKNISNKLLKNFEGKVPNSKNDLLTLDGVGNKTANCVLNEIYHQNLIAVDTHVQRICKRLNFVEQCFTAEEIENFLNRNLPENEKLLFSNRVIFFGRNFCKAKSPICDSCKIKNFCNYFKSK